MLMASDAYKMTAVIVRGNPLRLDPYGGIYEDLYFTTSSRCLDRTFPRGRQTTVCR